MHITVGDREVQVEQSSGRYYATFVPQSVNDIIQIPSDCIGTFKVDDIQLEEGSEATYFVEPSVESNEISGIFKDLKELDLKIEDKERGLINQIRINQDGLEQTIKDLERGFESRLTSTADAWQRELKDTKEGLESSISLTAHTWQVRLSDAEERLNSAIQAEADSLITLIEDADSDNFSRTEQLVNGLQSTVQGDLRSQRTQLENLITSSIEDATGANSTIWQTLDSHGQRITDNDGNISRVEQRVNGLRSSINNVDGKHSELTQTVNGLATRVSNVEGDYSSLTQTVEGFTSRISVVERGQSSLRQTVDGLSGRVSDVEGNYSRVMLAAEEFNLTMMSMDGDLSSLTQLANGLISRVQDVEGNYSNLTQLVDGMDTEISNVDGRVSRLTQTVDGLDYTVNNHNGEIKSQFRTLSGQIEAKVNRGDVEGIIRNSGDSIWVAVGNRVQTTADNAKMSGSEIKSAINLSRDGVRISGNMLAIDTQTTFANNVITNRMLATGITADKITTGTLDASRARIINLDVNSLTGNLANFVQTHWNNISTQISIDNRGINITGSDRWRRTYFNHTGVELFHGSGAATKAGAIGYFKAGSAESDHTENYFTRAGARHSIGIAANLNHDITLGRANDSTINTRNYKALITIRGDEDVTMLQGSLNAHLSTQGIELNSEQHRGDFGIQIRWNDSFRSRLVLSRNTYLEAQRAIEFYTSSGQRNFTMHGNNDSWRNISMHGNRVINESDRRKKRDIEDTLVDSIGAINRWTFVDYNWIDEEMDKRHGRQLGLIAQDTPELSEYDSEEDTWHVNNSKQMMMNSHAIQQLSKQTTRQFKTQEDQIFELQQELSKANRRIKELEEAKK